MSGGTIGNALTFDEYPRMDPSDAGRASLTGYGLVEGVRIPCIVAGAASALSDSITASDASLALMDASRMPSAPFTLQCGYERMLVTAVAGNTLSVQRGYDSTFAQPHIASEPAFEVPSEYVYLISDGPVHSVSAVYIDRMLQRDGFAVYTGQAGDSHPSWPGKAVAAFSAASFIAAQRNLKPSDAVSRKQGESAAQPALLSSNPEVSDGSSSSYASLSPSGQCIAWASFSSEPSAIKRTFKAEIINPSASAAVELCAILRSADTGGVLMTREVYLPALASGTLALEHTTAGPVVFALRAVAGDFRVRSLASVSLRERQPGLSDALINIDWPASLYSDPRLGDGIASSTASLSDSGVQSCFAAFPSEGPGGIFSQEVMAALRNPSPADSAEVELILASPDGACLARSSHTIGALSEETLPLSCAGGGWDALARVKITRGSLDVISLAKSALYTEPSTLNDVSAAPPSSARIVLGSEVTVDASWAVDSTGDCSGLGQPIERPDHVIRHFLTERMGFTNAEIDDDSFSAAGALYASAITDGYCFGFVMDGTRLASEWLRLLARESRSTLRYTLGHWRLDYVPDAAPSPVAAISQSELAGEGAEFVFSMQPMRQVSNMLTGRFRRNMSPEAREGGWLDTAEAADAGSIERYGVRSMEVGFEAVRGRAMAEHVMAHMLRERAWPLLTVVMRVMYNRFGLQPGDTIELEGGLYSGRFYIESIRRIDMATAEVKARQWWG